MKRRLQFKLKSCIKLLMKINKKLSFYCFRYQILPVSKSIQIAYAPHAITSYEQLISKKNELFSEALMNPKFLTFEKERISSRLENRFEEIYQFRVGFKKGLEVTNKDFSKSKVNDWPNTIVLVNNDSQVQKLLIQHNNRVSNDVSTVVNHIVKSLNTILRPAQLNVQIEPIFEAKAFWHLVKQYLNRITVVDFELVTPNLANISGNLSEELKFAQKDLNSVKLHLKFQSDAHSSLDLSEGNKQLNGIVDYASQGGGSARFKIRGFKKFIDTAKDVKEITIDELSFVGYELKDLKTLLSELFEIK